MTLNQILTWTAGLIFSLGAASVVVVAFFFFMGAMGQQAQLHRLQRVGEALYMATRWRSTEPNRLSLDEEARLWAEFRDALDLEPGTATDRGVGDPKAANVA